MNADDFSPAGRKQIVTIFGAADIDLPYITLGEEFMWLCYRCFVSRGQESIPLFGQYGHSPPREAFCVPHFLLDTGEMIL